MNKDKIFNPVTQAVDETELSKAFSKIQSKNRIKSPEQLKLVTDIKQRMAEMDTSRKNSCPHYLSPTTIKTKTIDEDGVTSESYGTEMQDSDYSWVKRWQRDLDLYMMKSGKNKFDSDLPEVTSPIIFSSIQAMVAQFQDANTTATFEATANTDPITAKIATAWLENWENKTNAQQTIKNPLFLEACIKGTAISYNARIMKTRTVYKNRTVEDILDEYGVDETTDQATVDQLTQAIMEKAKTNPKQVLTKEEELTEFDDFFVQKVPLEEFYIDESALEINGIVNEARDCIWKQYVTVQQVFDEYQNSKDPFVLKENLTAELIVSASKVSTEYEEYKDNSYLFLAEKEVSDKVCVIKYYNRAKDKFVVLANDIVIRDGCLPYNHKQLPFSKYIALPLTNSFYGVGFGTLLDNIQSQDELLQSLQLWTATYNANLPGTYTNASGDMNQVLKDTMEGLRKFKAGEFMKIGAGDKVERMEPIILGSEITNIRQAFDEKATRITFVNPLMNSIPSVNTAVRNNQQIQENSLLGIRMLVNNWGKGWEEAIYQGTSIVKQTEPHSYSEVEDYIEETNENTQVVERLKTLKKQYKTLETKGQKLETGMDGEKRMVESATGGTIELTPEVVDEFDKLKVQVRIETTALASRQLQAQQLQDTMTMAMNVLGNPAFAENKIILSMLKEFLEKRDVDPKILNMFEDENSDESDSLADYQNENLKLGNYEPPIPGMSQNHIMKHVMVFNELIMEGENLMLTLEDLASQAPEVDPMTGEPLPPQGLEQIQAQMDGITKIIRLINEHMAGDVQEKKNSVLTAISMANKGQQQSQGQPMPQPKMGMPPEGQMPPSPDVPIAPISQV